MKWWSNLIEITNYIFCRRKGLKEEKKFEWDRENNNKFFLAKKRRHDKDLQNYKKAKVDLGELNTTLIKAPSKQIVEFIDNLNKISTSYSINKISQTVEEEREEPNLTEGISLKEENFNVKNPSVITKLDFSNERIIYNKSSHKSLMHYVEESDLEVNFKILQGCIFDKTRRNNFPIIDFINYQKLQE